MAKKSAPTTLLQDLIDVAEATRKAQVKATITPHTSPDVILAIAQAKAALFAAQRLLEA